MLHKPWNLIRDGGHLNCSYTVPGHISSLVNLSQEPKLHFLLIKIHSGMLEHFLLSIFFMHMLTPDLFLCSAACFITGPLSPSLSFYSCIYILIRCGWPSQSCSTATSTLFALSMVWRLIYSVAGVAHIFTLSLCA